MIDIENTLCAHDIDSKICLPENIIICLHNKIVKTDINDKSQMLEELKNKLNCKKDEESELCIINNISNDIIPEIKKEKIKRNYFKPVGDIDPIAWLNNTNVDEVQEQLFKKYNSYYYSYIHMIDFIMFPPKYEVDHPIVSINKINFANEIKNINYENRVSTSDRPMKHYGTVFNTDPSSKQGQHWFALFFNFASAGTSEDPFTLEYFNSAGSDISNSKFRLFLEKLAITISKETGNYCKYIKVTNIQHQASHTGNCGVYSLYYIWNRLEGIPYKSFNDHKNIVTDDKYITTFRKKMFRTSE